MNPSDFDDLGIDAMAGTEIMGLLGLSPHQLNDPILFNRVSDVVGFLKNVPDKSFFVNKITAGKPVDKLSHVWSYIQVLNKRAVAEGELKKITQEQAAYE